MVPRTKRGDKGRTRLNRRAGGETRGPETPSHPTRVPSEVGERWSRHVTGAQVTVFPTPSSVPGPGVSNVSWVGRGRLGVVGVGVRTRREEDTEALAEGWTPSGPHTEVSGRWT